MRRVWSTQLYNPVRHSATHIKFPKIIRKNKNHNHKLLFINTVQLQFRPPLLQ